MGPVAKAISRANDASSGCPGAAGTTTGHNVTHATSLDAIARRQHFRTSGTGPARCATISVCKYSAKFSTKNLKKKH